MIIKDSVSKLLQYVREGEMCSCPIILPNDKTVELAVFTYYASEEAPITVFGYGRVIKTDGNNITTEEHELFQSEEELIVIKDVPTVPGDTRQILYDNYYEELQSCIDSLEEYGSADNISNLAKIFLQLIPGDALELYRRISPSFLELVEV